MTDRKYINALFFVTVDGESRPAFLTKVLGDVVGDPLRAHKDEDLGILVSDLVKVLLELSALLKVLANRTSL